MEQVSEKIKELCLIAYEEWDQELIVRSYSDGYSIGVMTERRFTITPYDEAVAVIEQATGTLVASVCD